MCEIDTAIRPNTRGLRVIMYLWLLTYDLQRAIHSFATILAVFSTTIKLGAVNKVQHHAVLIAVLSSEGFIDIISFASYCDGLRTTSRA